jgi:hypothetical protein
MLIVVWAFAVGVLTFANVDSPIRPFVVMGFVLVCPGLAFVRLLGLKDRMTELTLSLALSLALGTIVAEVMIVFARLLSPVGGLMVLIGISLDGVALQLIAARRTPAELRSENANIEVVNDATRRGACDLPSELLHGAGQPAGYDPEPVDRSKLGQLGQAQDEPPTGREPNVLLAEPHGLEITKLDATPDREAET